MYAFICFPLLNYDINILLLIFSFQMFPENVLKIIRKFADDVVISLQYSLEQVPKNLIYVKMKREQKDKMSANQKRGNVLFFSGEANEQDAQANARCCNQRFNAGLLLFIT